MTHLYTDRTLLTLAILLMLFPLESSFASGKSGANLADIPKTSLTVKATSLTEYSEGVEVKAPEREVRTIRLSVSPEEKPIRVSVSLKQIWEGLKHPKHLISVLKATKCKISPRKSAV